mmetsp:Transcript_1694/g.5333  ORF Transcript_1694/g.5333 Transcript_1694/m.5333 type:complete len:214 (+) Transcript_1694:701-1342(+)
MSSIQSNGFESKKIFWWPRFTSRWSATYLMYWYMSSLFIPSRSHGSASQMNSLSISTACLTILSTRSSGRVSSTRSLYRWHAKLVWRPSSLEISSLLKHRPGMIPRFLSQKMAQKDPEKNRPSTHAKATSLVAKLLPLPASSSPSPPAAAAEPPASSHSMRKSWPLLSLPLIHLRAHSAFLLTQGTVSMARKSLDRSPTSLTNASSISEYISE